MKNKKGFTLMEALAVVGISGFTATLALNVLTDSQEKENLEVFSRNVADIINGFDKRVSNDKFDLTYWDYSTVGYVFSNRQQVSDLIAKEWVAFDAPGCGGIDNWTPQKDPANLAEEKYKDRFKFVDCGLWESKMPYNLNAKAELLNDGTNITGFNLDLFFSNQEDFEKNFLSLKRVVSLARNKDTSNKAGTHLYQFRSNTTDAVLSSKECVTAGTDCILRASFTGSDDAYEYLYTNGNNNMVGSKIKFQQDITSLDAVKTCHRFKENPVGSGAWEKVDSVYCGIGYGFQGGLSTNPKLDYVEINTHSVTSDKIFLGSTCKFKNPITNATTDAPCGMYNEDGINKAVASYHEITATDALISSIDSVKLNANEAKIRNGLTVGGASTLKGNLDVAGTSDFTGLVTIEGTTADVNLVVESSASMKSVDIVGSLSVASSAAVGGDVNITQGLTVGRQLSTQSVKLSQTITSTNLGQDCKTEGNGTIVYFSAGQFSDLAVCANNKWKLVNTQVDQVVAFNGSCPDGFEDFVNADGRVLVGAGDLTEADGEKYEYTQGGVGGQSRVGLTVAEMPSHQHETQDAYFSEHWGNYESRNQMGSGDSDSDNNLYTRQIQSSLTGGGQSHENRMSYYVVNWCTYKG